MTTKARGTHEGSIYLRGKERREQGLPPLPGDGRWVGSVSAGWTSTGRRRHTVYGKTRQEVSEKLQRLQQHVAQGLPVVDERTTVRAYLEHWLQVVEVRPSTLTRYRGIVERQLVPALGSVKLAKLTPQAVTRMLSDLQRGGLSARTCHHVRAVLRGALADAARDGLVSRNAASLARSPKVESYHVDPMSPDHARSVLEAVAGSDLEAPVATALWTGLRQGELLGLRWSDVDLTTRRLSVAVALQRRAGEWHIQPTKTDKSRRTLSIPAPLVEVLSTHRQRQREAQLRAGAAWKAPHGDLVFTGPTGRPVMGATLTHRFHDAQVRGGLTPVRFHDLRHAAATLMLAGGVDLKVVSELLGHSTIATTANVYAGVLDSLKVDAAERMTRLMQR
jgi:integrase